MSTFQIKLLAIVLMVIDHIGLFFFPDLLSLRIVGRLSFPLFAWLIANGAYHTKNINSYFFRLLTFAFISQISYILAGKQIDPSFTQLNIFFTLTLGLGVIYIMRKTSNTVLRILSIFIISLGAILFDVSYGAAGVMSVVFFYLYFKDMVRMWISQTIIYFCFYTIPIISEVSHAQGSIIGINPVALVQPVAVLSLLFIMQYNGKQGLKWQYFFYIFYPVHLFIIYLLIRV